MDYYKLLGVQKGANEDEIKRAYRKLAQEHHPDRPTGNEKKFKEINEAYQVLSNKEKRAQYDRFGKTFAGGQGGGFGGFNPGDFGGFNVNFDGADMNGFGDFGDIFESLFTGMGGRKRKTYTRGSDLQSIQEITLEDAFHGVKKEVKFKAFSACETCTGKGYFEKEGTKTCGTCDGRGEVKEVRNSFFGNFQQVRPCTKCFGTGQIPNKVCEHCKGSGRVMATKTVNVEIVPGVDSGQLLKVPGLGEAGERGAPAGDLYIQIKVAPHKSFERHGVDLVASKEISMVDVLLGKKIELNSIGGEKLHVEIPAGFNVAEKLKVAGKGMPHFNSTRHGDLYLNLAVRTPKKLSLKAKKLLEELGGEME